MKEPDITKFTICPVDHVNYGFIYKSTKWLVPESMYFYMKLVICSNYMKFLRMLLPNYKKINVEDIITEAQKLSKLQTGKLQGHRELFMCVYVKGRVNKRHIEP